MITCPTCQNQEFVGVLFCSECGARLIGVDGSLTRPIKNGPTNPLSDKPNRPKSSPLPPPLVGTTISLHVLDTGQILPLSGREEYTLGRSAEGQSILPDIDLSNFHAYEKGVSRLHASIRTGGGQVTVSDLGSVNGTRINGKKIAPNQPQSLNHGDILTLGKLKVQVLTRR
jgi:pSer/pThr/pTyr-binding forkhead associated (FHA) protein